MITHLDHISLAVNDLSSSVAAYRRLLGHEPLWTSDGDNGRQAWFQLENLGLLLIAPTGAEDAVARRLETSGEGLWALAFAVRNAAEAQTRIVRRALKALSPAAAPYRVASEPSPLLVAIDPEDTAGLSILLVERMDGDIAARVSEWGGAGTVVDLDHVVINTPQPDRAAALYGARLGLDLRLDRSNAAWGARQMFFRCGGMVVEVVWALGAEPSQAQDRFGGLAWRVTDVVAAQTRLAAAALDISGVRDGRKPGSKVMTVRSGVVGAPSLIIEQGVRGGD